MGHERTNDVKRCEEAKERLEKGEVGWTPGSKGNGEKLSTMVETLYVLHMIYIE